jgi:hypothetical protein
VAGFDPAQALKVFPPEAAAKGLATGRGVVECLVTQDGGVTDCEAKEADPPGLGFRCGGGETRFDDAHESMDRGWRRRRWGESARQYQARP